MVKTHKHAPWRKSVLVPFWVIQLLFELLLIGDLALAENILINFENYYSDSDSLPIDDSTIDSAMNMCVSVGFSIVA